MIALAHPYALAGLATLPVLVWLHRRRRRPVPVVVPSLLFLEGEPADVGAPERLRSDPELWLSLLAAALVSLAAAAPTWTSGRPGRTVRVVVDASPGMRARDASGATAAERAEAAVDALRDALGPADRFLRVDVPSARLAAAAAAGSASLRVVVTDRARADLPLGVRTVLVGTPTAVNAGLVALDVVGEGVERSVHLVVWNDAPEAIRVSLARDGGASVALDVPPHGATRATLAWPVGDPDVPTEIRLADATGALASDDVVAIDPRPVLVGFATDPDALPPAYASAVRRALDAVAPGAWREGTTGPGLVWFGPAALAPKGTAVVVELHPVPAGATAVRAPPGAPLEPLQPEIAPDLDPTGCELVYAPSVAAGPPYPLVRARRLAPDGPLVLDWCPDPLAGAPAPVDHPVWPLFLDDVVAHVRGRAGPTGLRVRGLLDLEATQLGRDVAPFDPAWLASASFDRAPRAIPLPWPLLALGSICLGMLWLAPGIRAGARVR